MCFKESPSTPQLVLLGNRSINSDSVFADLREGEYGVKVVVKV